MRALRAVLIVVVILGGLFVIADRVAVHLAENEAADRIRDTEHLAATPDVAINGFPFLTQVADGTFDDVEVRIKNYEAVAGQGAEKIRVSELKADLRNVTYSGDRGSATARTATGTATIGYDELLRAIGSEHAQVAPGVSARVVGLSDGGDGKIKVSIEATVLGTKVPDPIQVLGSVTLRGDRVQVHADDLPELPGFDLSDSRIRELTDFQQAIDRLPGGIELGSVRAAKNGVEITVKGSDVRLEG
ncbi:DUF2993 domain-containing protein [Streptomyces sp. V3I7]|uniref:LmeA family phospholipid-binding protein n=1 Tax=Streptomyces sp. V3I7 TaxID=3042278 RepID=UPI002787825B|nr:DUF2993 domain-containing protein [Streptomyces sp. V3I7]MDQ0991676.1 hypothetical protein [Streptomyces sp. V3I7]